MSDRKASPLRRGIYLQPGVGTQAALKVSLGGTAKGIDGPGNSEAHVNGHGPGHAGGKTTLAAYARPNLGASAVLLKPHPVKDDARATRGDLHVPRRLPALHSSTFHPDDSGAAEMPEWYPYLKALKENPFRQEFIYLTLRDPDAVIYKPYDLKVVPHADVDPSHFYTMSAQGVTHVLGGVAEFVPLERFEREFLIFTKVSHKTIFRLFRLWKGFVCWKNYVRRKKKAKATQALESNLFHLNPIFQRALFDIQGRCVEVAAMHLHAVDEAKTMPLGAFLEKQVERRGECGTKLAQFGRDNCSTVQRACGEALDALQQRLFGSGAGGGEAGDGGRLGATGGGGGRLGVTGGGGMGATGRLGATGGAKRRGGGGGGGHGDGEGGGGGGIGGANGGVDDASRSYAVTAAKRSEQRRLASFIRLVDFMVQETLRDLLHDSMAGMLTVMANREQQAAEYERTRVLYEAAMRAKDVRASASKRSMARGEPGGGKKASKVKLGPSGRSVLTQAALGSSVTNRGGNNNNNAANAQSGGNAAQSGGGNAGGGGGATASGIPHPPSARGGSGRSVAGASDQSTKGDPGHSTKGDRVPSAASGRSVGSSTGEALLALEEMGIDLDDVDPAKLLKVQTLPPIFHVRIHLDAEEDALAFYPGPPEVLEVLENVMQGFLEVMDSVGRLLGSQDLAHFTSESLESPAGAAPATFVDQINDEVHEDNVLGVKALLHQAFERAERFKASFEPLRARLMGYRAVTQARMEEEVKEGARDLQRFDDDWAEYAAAVAAVKAITDEDRHGNVLLDLRPMKEALLPFPERCVAEIQRLLPRLAFSFYQEFVADVHAVQRRLARAPASVEDFVDYLEVLQDTVGRRESFDERNALVRSYYDLIDKFGIRVEARERAAFQTLGPDFQQFMETLEAAEAAKDALIVQFTGDLDAQETEMVAEATRVRNAAQEEAVLDASSDMDKALSVTTRLAEEVAELKAQASRVARYRQLFRLPERRYPELEESATEVELKHLMWQSLQEWEAVTAEWEASPFHAIDTLAVEETLARFVKTVNRIDRNLPPNKVVDRLKDRVGRYKEIVPVVVALRNPNMKPEHWFKVSETLNHAMDPDDERITLEGVLALGVMSHADAMVTVSTEATQEAHLLGMLNKIKDKWNAVDFAINPYKDTRDVFVLGGVEDVVTTLEDSMMTMMTITSSRFVSGIRDHVDRMESDLRLFSDTLDQWLEVQKTWVYLEPIFQSNDIRQQLPQESRKFAQVDLQFKEIMRHARERPSALQAGTTPGWLEKLSKCNEMLEEIEKNLETYLEQKKMAFPRFYFLSNNDLLEILSQGKEPQAVQPHLQKCFDGIARLVFGDQRQSPDIHAMVSAEGEEVALGNSLKARNNVEQWLGQVEKDMKATVRRLAKHAWTTYAESPRPTWVLAHPAQLVLSVSNVYWCHAVESCFDSPRPPADLELLHRSNVRQLSELTALVRGDLSKLERKILVSLITVDVHNRDIVEELFKSNVERASEFRWQMQLRYYFDRDADDLVIKQVNAAFTYGYEYLGAQPRLVVTPMTDRCYMTLTGALHLTLGGAPAGPAGTGKTETTKDLGKCLGVQCVVFNCGDDLNHRFMETFLCGLCQCGAWACLDEFNRIDIEVLSVVAQQLLQIQSALRARLPEFLFCGRQISLQPSFGMFTTMNPGYAGRTELPDNLKALFRPVAMMIPDYALVAEVMLFSEGFDDARSLSRKMVKLYKLSSEQLSQQDHYDFGMRALKSVLVLAGALKRAAPGLDEDVVLVRAMRDSNVPKFLEDDARLFNAIVQDLFPGRNVPDQDYGELDLALRATAESQRLQAKDAFALKAVQLYMTLSVRFGVMLVGPTGGGKSSVWRTLKEAMTRLRREGSRDPEYQRVHAFPFNPKAISKNEIYGYVDKLTGEWRNGLGATLIAEAKNDPRPDRKWVVFDGPVDALWIEDMNTVLDDNCTLCLANGQRIKLNPVTMRMLFEVEDLKAASPATVSRCGMVYVPEATAGWEAFARSWLARLGELVSDEDRSVKIPDETAEMLWAMLSKHVPAGLAFVRRKCTEQVPSADINRVASLTRWFQALVRPGSGLDLNAPTADVRLQLRNAFGFAFVWGIGGDVDSSHWDAFDTFAREQLEGDVMWPPRGIVHDYFVDTSRDFTMRAWAEVVPAFQYRPAAPYFQLLVPTLDTTRTARLLALSLRIQRPMLITGLSGVGKSAVVSNLLLTGDGAGGASLLPISVNFSAQTTSLSTQELIEGKMEKMGKRLVPPSGKKICLFVDDLNMPAREMWGAQPPLELLRTILDLGGMYDRKKLFWKELVDVTLVAACAPPGGGRQPISARVLRHFTMVHMPPPSEDVMHHIFSKILGGFMDHYFPPDLRGVVDPMVKGAVDIYRRISTELLPTPAKSHYTFSLRDVSKVFQGILLVRHGQCPDREALTRLWVHETMRVFHDRLVDDPDRQWFRDLVFEMLKGKFHVAEGPEHFFVQRDIMFADFLRMGLPAEERVYEEVQPGVHDMDKILTSYLEEFNDMGQQPMRLVFFADAIRHISRVARVLRQPRGNAMLVGVGGSGKQSLTRFASFLAEYQCHQIEITRHYGPPEFREDLKHLYKIAGLEGSPVVFLFTDNQIVDESFVEDLNNVLNSGEVPGMYPADEKEAVLTEMREYCQENNLPLTRDAIWSAFIDRVRDNLHVVLCMSPVGAAFRTRCRQFPSLVNCCTIDWFSEWPREALHSVSTRFLADLPLGDRDINAALADLCVSVHVDVAAEAQVFYEEMRRRFYTTPKSYLDMIDLYTQLYDARTLEMDQARDRLSRGLQKLDETNVKVAEMETAITELQPVLQDRRRATQELIEQVTREQEEAKEVEEVVGKEEAQVKEKTMRAKEAKDQAQMQLDQAIPLLQEAETALGALNKSDISEVKGFKSPPELVMLTMEGIMILLQEKKTDWDNAKRVLSDAGFMNRLYGFDRDNIPTEVQARLLPIIQNPLFQPATVGKQSNAARSLCMWVRAMDNFAKTLKVVRPLQERQAKAEAELNANQAKLDAKQAQLRAIKSRVKDLEQRLEDTQREQKELQEENDLSQARLGRAGKLTGALGDEAVRWRADAERIEAKMKQLVGDVFLAAATVSYLGAFTGPYRSRLTQAWTLACKRRGVPVSERFSLQETLSSAVEMREWAIQGLPSDPLSVDNGILATRGKRWPLMIDPQGQAHKWVRAMETKNGLRAVKQTDPNLARYVEAAVRNGQPVLIEDVGETLEPVLEPVLTKSLSYDASGRNAYIKLGAPGEDEMGTPYSKDFKLYISTKMANPHYLPEVCIKVTLINFTVTLQGLEDQLLTHVVRIENKDLEDDKNKLVVSISNDRRQLKGLEDQILKLLSDAGDAILDDDHAIKMLNNSKLTSGVIQNRVREAEVNEREINAKREQYRPAARRGSILYFVIADLASIDPMYQYSLQFFIEMYRECVRSAERADDVRQRLKNVMAYMTLFVFRTICRGLFAAHQSIFSFLICTSIKRLTSDDPEISAEEWDFLLRGPRGAAGAGEGGKGDGKGGKGGKGKVPVGPPNPDPSWITPAVWQGVLALQASCERFDGLADSVARSPGEWRAFAESPAPLTDAIPMDWGLDIVDSFMRLLCVRVFREEALASCFAAYVDLELGRDFIEIPPFQLSDVFPETRKKVPVVFVLTTGADPTGMLQRFAESKGRLSNDKLHIISLGSGQGPHAENVIEMAKRTGDWVCLQNCHLARSWMTQLERKVEELQERSAGVHADFRLWLTSMPAAHFPVPVLQSSIKITVEPPKGLKANLTRTYNDFPESFLSDPHPRPEAWRRLVFACSFFHAAVQERRKFGPLGWNIRYEFSQGDLDCSLANLRSLLAGEGQGDNAASTPWDALLYITGDINYGGRVTDDNDRHLLKCILRQFYTPKALDDKFYITRDGLYQAPHDCSRGRVLEYLKNLPATEGPEVFGMHENADITFQLQETRRAVDAILAMQPRVAAGAGKRPPAEVVAALAAEIEASLPPPLDLSLAPSNPERNPFAPMPSGHDNSLGIVLRQEADRFQALLSAMRTSLQDLQRAIQGLVVMSGDLEAMFGSLLDSRVPALWEAKAYPSLKPLGAWTADFLDRMRFVADWITRGEPASFWLPGLFFPQGFMTAVLQNHARKTQVPVDRLNFAFEVLQTDDVGGLEKGPTDGAFVHGLFLESARWDPVGGCLATAAPREMYARLPVVHLVPRVDYEPPEDEYQCPLYKTSLRAGTLNTTGQSTNFVLYISLKLPETLSAPSFWTLQGVAALCALDT